MTRMPKPIAFLTHHALIWLLLALPGIGLFWPIVFEGYIPPRLLVESGEWAMRLLVLTLVLTPLQRLFRKSRLVHWFVRRRRWFGVASFAYAGLHVGFYLWDLIDAWGSVWLTRVLFVATNLFALAGWVAIILYLPLALSSNDLAQRGLGRWWKWLQRLTYFAALTAAIHWLMLANRPATWLQLGVLMGLEAVRLALPLLRRRGRATGATP